MGECGHFGAALSEMFGLSEAEGVTLARRLLGCGVRLAGREGGEDLVAEALTRAVEQRRRGVVIDNPYGWMATVMHHMVAGAHERAKRQRAWEAREGAREERAAAPSAQIEARQELKVKGARLREVLDEISWAPTRSNGVHLFAVLLLALRLNALARHEAALDAPTRAALEAVVRWHEAEGQWRLAPGGWPRLLACWLAVVRRAERSSLPLLEALRLLEAELAPGLGGVWHQWRRRATKQALQRCPEGSRLMLEEMLTLRGEAA
jgi:DNA-directed RNA polymerase specialized sigma24 family protein